MSTAEEELEMLVEKYSEGELKQAQREIGFINPEEREKIENKLTKFTSKNAIRSDLEGEITSATIVDMGLLDEDEDEFYFKFELPCNTTVEISFNGSDFQENGVGTEFLGSIGCTVSDLSDAVDRQIPISYEKTSSGGWKVVFYYGERSVMQDIVKNPEEYKIKQKGIFKHISMKEKSLPILSPIISAIIVNYLLQFLNSPYLLQIIFALSAGVLTFAFVMTIVEEEADCRTDDFSLRL